MKIKHCWLKMIVVLISTALIAACGKDEPTAPVTVKFIKVASPSSGVLAATTSNSSANTLNTITFTPSSYKFPVSRVEFLPDPGSGKGVIFDGNELVTVTPSASQEALLTTSEGKVAPGTYTGLRVVFTSASDSNYTAYIKSSFEIYHGTRYVTGSQDLVQSSDVSPADQPVTIKSSRSELTFAAPLTLTQDQPITIYVYLDPTHLGRAGFGGTNGSRYWSTDCTGTINSDTNIVTSGAFVCASIPRFFATTEEITPSVERYIMYSILHVCNSDGSDDSVDDSNSANSAVYSLFFHPTSGTYLGGITTRFATEGADGGGEPAEAGYAIESLADNGNSTYMLKCATSGGSTDKANCEYSSFQRQTHQGRYSNRNQSCWGYGAIKL
ncbi:MAG: hypothetical protein AABZ06_10340 [Bdellovibrionota bacterium]